MKLKSNCISKYILTLIMTGCTVSLAGAKPLPEIEIGKQTFVVPQFSGPYREREASIAPEEYEQAEMLKGLLEADNKKAVLTELEKFYDIELSPAMQTLKAQVYFSLQMFEEAEKTYLAVLERQPELIRAHADLGQLYLLTDRPKLARKYFARAVEYGAGEALIHGQLGYLNLTQYGPFSAISEYQKALALEPENSQWQQGLLAALTQANMFEAANAMLSEVLALQPKNPNLWLNKATLELKQERNTAALASLEMALLLGDKSANNLRIAAQLHLAKKSYDRALTLIEQHIKAQNFDAQLSITYLEQLKHAEKWHHASQLIKTIEPKLDSYSAKQKSIFYQHKASVLTALNKSRQAGQFYQLAVDENPLNGIALVEYAQYCVEQKQYAKAEILYIRAEAIETSEKNAMIGRVQLYLSMQDYSSALKHLRAVYVKFPDTVGLSDKIEIIENIIKSQGTST